MIYKNLSHKTLLVLVTCITSICILAFGMRAPDLSRPHRPKPKPRAYLEEQVKKSPENVAKKPMDHLVADVPPVWATTARATFRTAYTSSFEGAAAATVFPTPSRAPPGISARNHGTCQRIWATETTSVISKRPLLYHRPLKREKS